MDISTETLDGPCSCIDRLWIPPEVDAPACPWHPSGYIPPRVSLPGVVVFVFVEVVCVISAVLASVRS